MGGGTLVPVHAVVLSSNKIAIVVFFMASIFCGYLAGVMGSDRIFSLSSGSIPRSLERRLAKASGLKGAVNTP